jgi:hypothetical protein
MFAVSGENKPLRQAQQDAQLAPTKQAFTKDIWPREQKSIYIDDAC